MQHVDLRIVEDDLRGPAIRALLRLHFESMIANSPEGSAYVLDVDALRHPTITFWSAWDANGLAGCGALKELDSLHGEVKSMRTAETHLGKQVGTQVLAHIVETARHRGYKRISLETGSTEPFAAAHKLYARFGFEPCEAFGDYRPGPFNQFFTLAL
jgi:putative acetyltransferase